MSAIHEALNRLAHGADLSGELAGDVMVELLAGELTPAQTGGLLLGLRTKGESAEEIAAFAQALRRVCVAIPAPEGTVDTCGTGGDGGGTFNISTTAAFVVAGAGVPVAKHGNRFSSGKCGSADVLEQLGVPLDLAPLDSTACLAENGMAFLYAPNHHPAMAKVGATRRELGVRTIFNLLGPLLNPAAAQYQLLGVAAPELVPKMAEALSILGIRRAVVVHGEDGLDEVTLTGRTQACLVAEGKVMPFEIIPEDYGFQRCSLEHLHGGDSMENARLTLGILQGELGPRRDIVVLNAAVALFAAERVKDIREGVLKARESIDSGRALAKLEALCELKREVGKGVRGNHEQTPA